MMGYDHGYVDGGPWVWVFGGLVVLGVLALIGVAVWAIVTVTNRTRRGTATSGTSPVDGRTQLRQVLDERYARGEMTTEEYTERLHILGL